MVGTWFERFAAFFGPSPRSYEDHREDEVVHEGEAECYPMMINVVVRVASHAARSFAVCCKCSRGGVV